MVKLDGSDPLLLNGYGSYEVNNDPWFNANRLCLLDRGFVFAMVSLSPRPFAPPPCLPY